MTDTDQLRYLRGDATNPVGKGRKIIAHVCNDLGGWGKGFVVAISRKWKQPETAYRAWYRERADNDFGLGAVQFVEVSDYIWIANMIGQRGIKRGSSGPPVRYDAIAQALARVAERAVELDASVHMPRIGCGLAGGKWSKIEPLIEQTLVAAGVSVVVYDFE